MGKSTELRYGFTTEPATLDPLSPANTADGRSILFNVFESLVKPDTEGRLLPCLAESWTVEQDGIDGANITGSMVAQLDKKNFDTFLSYSAAVQLLALNNAATPLDDIRVRRALNYGINIQEIIDTAFFGLGTPSSSPIIPGLSAYYENSSIYPYNPDTARALLAQADFNEGRAQAFDRQIQGKRVKKALLF